MEFAVVFVFLQKVFVLHFEVSFFVDNSKMKNENGPQGQGGFCFGAMRMSVPMPTTYTDRTESFGIENP